MASNIDQSQKDFQQAQKLLPGGVNSPVRAFKSVGGTPRFFARAAGAYVWDVDGNQYIDYVGSWGPMILGHTHPDVVRGVQETAALGMSFGAPCELEIELAQLVIDMVPSIEVVRFVNSGSEATMSALRLARGFTGRDKFIKFDGGYHGHADGFLVKAGSGAATFGEPDSAGRKQEAGPIHPVVGRGGADPGSEYAGDGPGLLVEGCRQLSRLVFGDVSVGGARQRLTCL